MTIFRGSAVAIVTPFHEDQSINFEELGRLIDFQIENGTNAIVICGTTGEASTMTDEEQISAIRFAVEHVNKRVPVIAGAGSNDTRHGVNLSIEAEKAGADALLHVSPYYNKTNQTGLYAHFIAIADAVNIPIILYNVPGRTGQQIAPDTVLKLSAHKNIVAIKDATGDLGYTVKVASLVGDDFAIYSGNDDVVVPLLSVGGQGVISVVANCCPKETNEMVMKFLDGDIKGAADIQTRLKSLIDLLFVEPNPIPIKAVMALMGYETDILRLPLGVASEATVNALRQEMQSLGML